MGNRVLSAVLEPSAGRRGRAVASGQWARASEEGEREDLREVTELINAEVHILIQAVLASRHLLSTAGVWALEGKTFRK